MAAIENNGEANPVGKRWHQRPVQSVTGNLAVSLKVDGTDSVIKSAFAITIRIPNLEGRELVVIYNNYNKTFTCPPTWYVDQANEIL